MITRSIIGRGLTPIVLRSLLALGVAACAADSLVLPSEGKPAEVSILAGDQQRGMVGTPLADSLSVLITDGQDRPVVHQPVDFVITSGGAIQPSVVVTDSAGKAHFLWVLGSTAGTQSLEVGVSVSGHLSPLTTFRATADPGLADTIAIVGGTGQTAQAGSPLPESLAVKLTDSFGNAVPGTDVTWLTSNGSLSATTVTSGLDGRAAVIWTLGSSVGTQSAQAQLTGVNGSPATFAATATLGAPPRLMIVTEPSGSAQSGVVFSQQPSIQLADNQGAPIAQSGVAITAAIASGGGALGGTTTIPTDASGVAQFTDLSISGVAGSRTLIFATAGYTAATSTSINVTTPSVSATQSTVSAAPATIEAGNGSSVITVTARDDAGNAIAGLTTTIAVSGNGNTVTQPAGPTDANGVATGSVSSTSIGTKTVTATISGVAIVQTAAITVVPGPPVASTTTAQVRDGRVLVFTTFTIFTRDAFGNALDRGGFANLIRVVVQGRNSATPSVVDMGDGTYTASYLPILKGDDQVIITLGGVQIKGSPYHTKVH
jgi:hypothetical protein